MSLPKFRHSCVDRNRSERTFEVGDEVYLKLQPFRQNSVALRRNLKLSNRYYGPYKVIEKVGKVAYKLQLPPTSQVHNVFHVSLLKKKISSKHISSPDLPFTTTDGSFQTYPHKVLDKRLVKRHNSVVTQILVQWENLGPSQATWEDYHQIVAQFPSFDPWGQGFSSQGGNVTFNSVNSENWEEVLKEEDKGNGQLLEMGVGSALLADKSIGLELMEIGLDEVAGLAKKKN